MPGRQVERGTGPDQAGDLGYADSAGGIGGQDAGVEGDRRRVCRIQRVPGRQGRGVLGKVR